MNNNFFSDSEYGIAVDKYKRKAKDTKNKGKRKFLLSLREYCQLICDAGILPSQLGAGIGKYNLGRKNEVTGATDVGDYYVGNCRFILHTENASEAHKGRKFSTEHKRKISENNVGFSGMSHSTESKKKTSETLKSLGRKVSKASSNKRNATISNGPMLVCPHCTKSGVGGNFSRHHFDNCKRRNL